MSIKISHIAVALFAVGAFVFACSDDDSETPPKPTVPGEGEAGAAGDPGTDPGPGTNPGGGNGGGNGNGNGGNEEQPPPSPTGYGQLNVVGFNTTFIMDASQMNDQAYQGAHLQQAMQMTLVWAGEIGSAHEQIPMQAQYTIGFAMHDDGVISVQQMTANVQNQTLVPFGPIMELMMRDSVQPGPLSIGLDNADQANLYFYQTSGNSVSCIEAIGKGSTTIEIAQNTTAVDGGSLKFSGGTIELYHPSETPYGDLSTQLGPPPCPKK